MSFRFEDPLVLWLLIAIPILAIGPLLLRTERGAVSMGSIAPGLQSHRTWRIRLEPWLLALRLAAIALLVVAIARPQRGEAVAETEDEGIDIVLAYDISSSMSELFARGESRQQAAEDVLKEFIEGRENDRVGLVAFRENAISLSPLTVDYEAVSDAVEFAPTLRLEDGTAIGSAIAESVGTLRSSEAESRIVILLTDGDNNAGAIEPLAAARLAESLGIRAYTIGVVSQLSGRPQSTINVDEAALREIANVTGGTYNRAQDPEALQQIYETIGELEKSRFDAIEFTRYDELAPWLLAVAVFALAAEVFARTTLLRRSS